MSDPSAWFAILDPLSHRRTKALLGLGALLVLSALPLLLLAPMLTAPLEPDEGVYATIAQGWRDGSLPYRDLLDNKAPILYLWYVASFSWLGESVFAPRILAGLAAGATVPFVWATGRTLFGQREGMVAAALFALSFVNIYLQVTANAEVFMLLPLTAGLWAFSMGARGGRLVWYVAAGILTALAVFTKQSALWAFVGYALWLGILVLRGPAERQRLVLAGTLMAAGAVLVAAAPFAYFAAHNALDEFWYAMAGFNRGWASQEAFYRRLLPPVLNPATLGGGLVFWGLAAVGVWRLVLSGDRRAWLVISFLAVAEAAAQTTGRLYPHYSVHLLPGAALAGAVGLGYVLERWRAGERALGMGVAAAAIITLAAAAFIYAQPTAEDRFEVQYGFQDTKAHALLAPTVAEAVAAMTEPGDYVFEWGRESEIYFLADRRPASRFFYNRHYLIDPSTLDDVLADLERTRPAAIYFTYETEERSDEQPPEALAAFRDAHYEFAGRVENADLYRRRGG
jgi:4-amino-4-deoxy-L-arabinose transferase-like glycosyltransferase